MAQTLTLPSGVRLIEPMSLVEVTVRSESFATALAGIVTVVGEADEGPGFQDEADLNEVIYAPDEIGTVIQKYKSGRIVDAFRMLGAPANDPAIAGSVTGIRIVKTNRSAAATAAVARQGFGAYASLKAKREGTDGNLIKYDIMKSQLEEAATTGMFAIMPTYGSAFSFKLRVNGGAQNTITVGSKQKPSVTTANMEDLTKGILAQGGQESNPVSALVGLYTLAASVPAGTTDQLLVTLQAGQVMSPAPAAGDTIIIPAVGDFGASADSSVIGGTSKNAGAYLVLSVSNTTSESSLLLKKLSGPTLQVEAVAATTIATTADLLAYKPAKVTDVAGDDRRVAHGVSDSVNPFSTTVSLSGSTYKVVLSLPTGSVWAAKPQAGDIMTIPATFAGVLAGHYLVTSATDTSLSADRLSNGSAGASGTQVVATPISDSNEPFKVSKPEIDGLGKSIEIEDTTNGLASVFRNKDTGASAGLGNSFLTSAAELQVTTDISKGSTTESFEAGGEVVIEIGSTLTSPSIIIDATKTQFKSGATVLFTATHKQYPTLKQLADYVSSQTGWKASVSLPKFNNMSPTELDRGTFAAGAIASNKPARIKHDAQDYLEQVSQSTLLSLAVAAQAGLPETVAPGQFLAGGAKAGSTAADFVAAIDALEALNTNFVVPLISKDASEDIAAGETEATSTYSVDAVNAYLNAHAIKMSSGKARKRRQAVIARSGAYSDQKKAAQSINSFRSYMIFQDIKFSNGLAITQYAPWMGAVCAAGMQAAAGYKGIVRKFANISGIAKPEGDFNVRLLSQREDALLAGLQPINAGDNGGFYWTSDQSTYSTDDNFVYNSMQAVYLSDLIASTLEQALDRQVVGKSVAEVSAATGASIVESQMFNFLRLRWTSPSDDAPKGFKNLSIKLKGSVMQINLEAKLNGVIKFVPVNLTLSEVEQSA